MGISPPNPHQGLRSLNPFSFFYLSFLNDNSRLINLIKSLTPLFKAGGSPEGSALWPPEAENGNIPRGGPKSLHSPRNSRVQDGLVAIWVALTVLPIGLLIAWSFAGKWFWPALIPGQWGLRGWRYVFSSISGIWPALGNSIAVAAGATAICLVVGLPAGRALGLYRFAGRETLRALLFLPVLVPPIAYVLGMHWAFLRLGLADSMLGVVLSHTVPGLPFMVMSLAAQFANLDTRFEEQARSLGANRHQVLTRVTLPLIFPGLITGILLTGLVSWSQYLLSVLIGGGQVPTIPQLVFAFASGPDSLLMATFSVVFIIPPLCALALLSLMPASTEFRRAL